MRPFVVYWNNIPAPYMVERFNALADRGKLDFEAWFNERRETDRSWEVDESSWRFPYRYLPTLRIGKRRIRFPLPLLGKREPDVLVSLYAEPIFLVGWMIARWRKVHAAFRVLVTFDSWIHRRWWKEWIKRKIFCRVDGIITVGHDGAEFAKRYGAAKDNIFFVTHSIDVSHFRGSVEALRSERGRLRQDLGLRGVTFIYVGRLWRGKGLDYLIDAFKQVQQRSDSQVSLFLVGDGEEEKPLKEKCAREAIRDVIFAGFHQKSELPRLYAAADVFVFPTLGDPYGLVVDEAMACSLPIISTSAAGEIRDRVEDGVNGFIVPPEDSQALSEGMERLALDTDLRKRMGRISAEKIRGHTPEKWAEDFEKAVNEILKMPLLEKVPLRK